MDEIDDEQKREIVSVLATTGHELDMTGWHQSVSTNEY